MYLANVAIFKPEFTNAIYTGTKLTGVRKAAFSHKLNITEVLKKVKSIKVSLNDYVLACITLAMSQICDQNTN